MGSPIFLFWLLFQCNMKVFSAIWTMKYLFNISNKTHCNLCLCWNTEDAKFPKHLFRGLTYSCRIWLTRTTTLTLTGTRKPTVKCLITRSNSEAWLFLMGTLVITRLPRIWKHADFRPNQYQNIPFTYKQSNTMIGLQMRQHVSIGCWYTTFVYIWSSQLSKII